MTEDALPRGHTTTAPPMPSTLNERDVWSAMVDVLASLLVLLAFLMVLVWTR